MNTTSKALQVRKNTVTLNHLHNHKHASRNVLNTKLKSALVGVSDDETLSIIGTSKLLGRLSSEKEAPDVLDTLAAAIFVNDKGLSLKFMRAFLELGKLEAAQMVG